MGTSLKERVRGKWLTWDQAALMSEIHSLIFKRYLYTFLYIEGNERCKVIQSQPDIPAVLPLSKPWFFLHTFLTNDVVLCTVSSGLGGLWTFHDPLLIKAAQPENFFPSKCFFFIFLIYVSLRKCQTELTFFTEQRCSELQERTNELKSDMVKFKATLVFLTFSLC